MNELTKANLREMFHSMSNSDFEIFYNKIMENAFLKEQLQEKENIIKEVREILKQDKASPSFNTAESIALNILDKENK